MRAAFACCMGPLSRHGGGHGIGIEFISITHFRGITVSILKNIMSPIKYNIIIFTEPVNSIAYPGVPKSESGKTTTKQRYNYITASSENIISPSLAGNTPLS